MSKDLLTIKNLDISYGDETQLAVRNFNLQVREGEIVSIVGESGSGKTSVIRAVLGLLSGNGVVSRGEILFRDHSLLSFNKEQWRNIRGTDIAMIFQDSRSMINPIRKIGKQYIEYIQTHRRMSKEEAYKKAVEMLKSMHLVDVENIMNSYAFELSGGMCQRVGIAMAMTFSPQLLLADEPTSALDVTIQMQIVREIMQLRKNFKTSVIMVTHNIGVAAYMADHLIVMKNGEIVDEGTREQVIQSPKSQYTRDLLSAVPELGGKRYVE